MHLDLVSFRSPEDISIKLLSTKKKCQSCDVFLMKFHSFIDIHEIPLPPNQSMRPFPTPLPNPVPSPTPPPPETLLPISPKGDAPAPPCQENKC